MIITDSKTFLEKTYSKYLGVLVRPKAVLGDGTIISIQASEFHYCVPKSRLKNGNYSLVEVQFSRLSEEEIEKYKKYIDSSNIVYDFPVTLLDEYIVKHGGIVNF